MPQGYEAYLNWLTSRLLSRAAVDIQTLDEQELTFGSGRSPGEAWGLQETDSVSVTGRVWRLQPSVDDRQTGRRSATDRRGGSVLSVEPEPRGVSAEMLEAIRDW